MIFFALEREIEFLCNQEIDICGRKFDIPRMHTLYGENGLRYKYSGFNLRAKPWTPVLSVLRDFVNKLCGQDYNVCFITRYENGKDCLNFCTDMDSNVETEPGTCYLSLGASRDFIFRNKGFVADQSFTIRLGNGALIKASPPTDDCYSVGIPQRPLISEPTLNLAFKRVKPVRKPKKMSCCSEI